MWKKENPEQMLASREGTSAIRQGIFSHDILAWIQWLFVPQSPLFPLQVSQATSRSLPTLRQRMWGPRRRPHDCIYFYKLLSGHSCYILWLVSLVNVIIGLRDGPHLSVMKKNFFSECQIMNITHKSLLEELAGLSAQWCTIPRIHACFLQTSLHYMNHVLLRSITSGQQLFCVCLFVCFVFVCIFVLFCFV